GRTRGLLRNLCFIEPVLELAQLVSLLVVLSIGTGGLRAELGRVFLDRRFRHIGDGTNLIEERFFSANAVQIDAAAGRGDFASLIIQVRAALWSCGNRRINIALRRLGRNLAALLYLLPGDYYSF